MPGSPRRVNRVGWALPESLPLLREKRNRRRRDRQRRRRHQQVAVPAPWRRHARTADGDRAWERCRRRATTWAHRCKFPIHDCERQKKWPSRQGLSLLLEGVLCAQRLKKVLMVT